MSTFNWNVGSTVTIGPNGTMTVIGGTYTVPSGRTLAILLGGKFTVQQ